MLSPFRSKEFCQEGEGVKMVFQHCLCRNRAALFHWFLGKGKRARARALKLCLGFPLHGHGFLVVTKDLWVFGTESILIILVR